MTNKTPNPVGRPRRGQAKITEGDYPEIYSRWVKGTSIHALAAEYHVDWRSMSHHLQKCKTLLTTIPMMRDRNDVLEELRLIRAAAWEAFQKSKRSLTHDEIAKEVDRIAIEKGVSEEIASRLIKQTTRVTMRDGGATWLSVIMAAIDLESKLVGHYETGKREGQKPAGKGSYRAAGRTPEEHHEAMAQRLMALLTNQQPSSVQLLPPSQALQSPVTTEAMEDVISGKTPARLSMPLAAIKAAQATPRQH